jgi:nicotinamidase-related amidase
MLNKILNTLSAIPIKMGLKTYQNFPSNQTALLLVNCQKGFLTDQAGLKKKLEDLITFARQKHWKIIHAPFIYSERKFPSPAQLLMDEQLKSAASHADLLYVESGDITLPARSSLSAFSETDLEDVLKQHGLEHVVLAGPMANLSLDSTMRDGVQKDFHIAVVTDATTLIGQSYSVDSYRSTLEKYAQTVTDLSGLKKISARS